MTQAFCQLGLLDVTYAAAAWSRSTIRRIRRSSADNDDDDGLDINVVCGNDDYVTGECNSDGDTDNGGSNGGCGLDGNGETTSAPVKTTTDVEAATSAGTVKTTMTTTTGYVEKSQAARRWNCRKTPETHERL